MIGLGFVGFLQLVYLLKKINEAGIRRWPRWSMAAFYGAACFIILMAMSVFIYHHYPVFLHTWWILALFSAAFAGMITLVLADLPLLAALAFLVFTLVASFRIMPLYRGLGIMTHGKVISQMAAVSKPSDAWVTVGTDAGAYENFGLLAGRPSLSGTQFVPELKFWGQLGAQYETIYNREGHAFFSDDPSLTQPIEFLQTDAFMVKFECSNFIKQNAQFALSVHPLVGFSCIKLVQTIKYPQITFYLYRISPS